MDCSIKEDRWGYPVKTTSDACISAINSYYEQVLSYGRNSGVIAEAAAQDKDCVLANVLACYFCRRRNPTLSAAHLSVAKRNLDEATDYEKSVYKAVTCLMDKNLHDDVVLSSQLELISKYPRDLASLKRAQIFCFYLAQPAISLDLVEKVLPVNKQESYVYGMLSFPLLELGRMEDAEAAAREGLSINKDDQWSQHALCHVLQYECRFKEAIAFMEASSNSWTACCSFMLTHNWWHVALCYLDGESLEKAIEVYDQQIWTELVKVDADAHEVYLNALGFLLRVHLRGYTDIISRIRAVGACVSDQSVWGLEWMLDIFMVWALSHTGEISTAKELLNVIRSRLQLMNEKKQKTMQRALLLAEALYEYGRGDHHCALGMLGPDFRAHDYKIIGASDEQLDVFTEVWYSILLNTGHASKAISEIETRVQIQQGIPFMWRLLEKAHRLAGSTGNAEVAAQKAQALEAAYFEENV